MPSEWFKIESEATLANLLPGEGLEELHFDLGRSKRAASRYLYIKRSGERVVQCSDVSLMNLGIANLESAPISMFEDRTKNNEGYWGVGRTLNKDEVIALTAALRMSNDYVNHWAQVTDKEMELLHRVTNEYERNRQ